MKDQKKILICFNEPVSYYENYLGKEAVSESEKVDLSEKDFFNQISNIKSVLETRFESVKTIPFNKNLVGIIRQIEAFSPDVILNFVESVEGNSNFESYVAGLFDLLGYNYSGNDPIALSNCLTKSRTKQILTSHNLRTPKYLTVKEGVIPTSKSLGLSFPVISKLAREDASIGISEFSVSSNYSELKKRLNYLFETFRQDVIIEEYIEGRELNVAILGKEILPISEIRFDGLPEEFPKIVTYEAKWSPESIYYKYTIPKVPADIPSSVKTRVEKLAIQAFEALECRDYARVDIRLSRKNIPYVIEVNPNPDISPDAGFVRSAAAAGISYEDLLFRLISFASKRIPHDTQIAI